MTPNYPTWGEAVVAFKEVLPAWKGEVPATPVLAKAGWVIQGYAQKELIGEDGVSAAAVPNVASEREAIAAVEAVVNNDVSAAAPLPWKTILQIALKLIADQLLKNAA